MINRPTEMYNMDQLEYFFTNPGLNHIGKQILSSLDHQSLLSCQKVSKSWKSLADHIFEKRFILWLENCSQRKKKHSENETVKSQDHLEFWKKLVQMTQHTNYIENVSSLLNNMFQKEEIYFFASPLYIAWVLKGTV